MLRYFEDLSSREIASILRIHDGAVRFRLMVAKLRLRQLLGGFQRFYRFRRRGDDQCIPNLRQCASMHGQASPCRRSR
ncbi:MAG TPA: sigma factor-like helix-turn-helix DNA-binding protein [Candidatus Binatia bacterium]|nr:sigma factor-like helix-turn-helix DNA-binding protein [Candidatus Binatia bacterium]